MSQHKLHQLEIIEGGTGTGVSTKLKSKRGGSVDVYVKHKSAWPHEVILGHANRTRLNYDQLTSSQWVQGFCRNVLDDKDRGRHE